MKIYLANIVFGMACAPSVLAQTLPFAGRWQLEGPAAPAAYTSLAIEGTRMAWRTAAGSAPGCVQEFTVKPEQPGTVYLDGRGTKFVAGVKGSLPTYLLTLGAGTCGAPGAAVRISYPLVYDVSHIEVIDYAHGKPVGSRRLRRRN